LQLKMSEQIAVKNGRTTAVRNVRTVRTRLVRNAITVRTVLVRNVSVRNVKNS
jgi:hypothetical protein